MPGSGKKKKKGSGSQALGAEETGSTKESKKKQDLADKDFRFQGIERDKESQITSV